MEKERMIEGSGDGRENLIAYGICTLKFNLVHVDSNEWCL